MAVITREKIMEHISALVGEDTSDEVLTIIEDITDTLDQYENASAEDWETKYIENDKNWREKYKERFFSAAPTESADTTKLEVDEEEEPEDAPKEFTELFNTEDE